MARKSRSRAARAADARAASSAIAGDAPKPAPRVSRPGPKLLYLAFTLSGLAGLIYEATWTRYLQLFLGHTAYAQVLVLSLFMGGMGAGALLAGRLARGRLSGLAAYAAIEAILGLFAFAFHPLFAVVTDFAFEVAQPAAAAAGLDPALIQWLIAGAMILPQSVLLGMTFPLMSGAILRAGTPAPGRVFAMLYFTNSAGAVAGVLLAGFVLTERLGLQATMAVAGAVNLAVAALAFGVARRVAVRAVGASDTAGAASVPPDAAAAHRPRSSRLRIALLAFAFLTAVASFFYEIAWLRLLALVQGASTHAFETMLAAFILGIALGGLYVRRRIERDRAPLRTLAIVQVLMGLAALATLPLANFAFDGMAAALRALRGSPLGYAGYNATGFLLSAAIMAPATFFAGMTLPLLTHVLYREGRGEPEIGAVYGWNTLGGIAGIALAGLVLMPLVGVKNLIVAGAAIDMALGIALLAYLRRTADLRAPRFAAGLAATAVVAALAMLFAFRLDPARLVSGVFRTGDARIAGTSKILYYADGRTATVSVVEQNNGTVSIATNGKPDAAIRMRRARGDRDDLPSADEYTMSLAAVAPLVHLPQAKRAAIIGHGSGLTTHALLASPVIESVDVIEIEPEMIEAARAFLPRVARAYDDPRARFRIEDARAFFARAPGRYDLIVSEPSNPWVSGVATLFTPQFYAQAKRALAPGGIFVQWFHVYEMDRSLVRSIVGALAAVFPDYAIYAADDADVIVVASPTRLPAASDALFEWPAMQDELGYLGLSAPAQLDLFRIATRRGYGPLLEGGPRNDDYFPILEFGAARARYEDSNDSVLVQLARNPLPLLEILSGLPPPRPAPVSDIAARRNARFDGHRRATLLAQALDGGAASAAFAQLAPDDAQTVRTLAAPPATDARAAWDEWFAALLFAARPIVPNGVYPQLEAFLRRPATVEALRRAPADIQEKVIFLALTGRRDLEQIRRMGPQLLAGPLQRTDFAFHGYVVGVTLAACLAAFSADAVCRQIVASLDTMEAGGPLPDLLRAHRRQRP